MDLRVASLLEPVRPPATISPWRWGISATGRRLGTFSSLVAFCIARVPSADWRRDSYLTGAKAQQCDHMLSAKFVRLKLHRRIPA